MSDLRNCFFLLDLNPDENDTKIIEQAILKKRVDWSRLANSPNQEIKRNAQRCMDELDKIKDIMLNPEKRAAEALKAKEEIKQQKEAHRKEFESAVELLSKGKVTDQAIKNITARFKDAFYTEADVRTLLNQFLAAYKRNPDAAGQTFTLEPSQIANIRANLKIASQKSLYHFLGVASEGRTLPLETLRAKAETISSDIRKRGGTSPLDSVWNILVGECLNIFSDERKRRAYNQCLDEEKYEPFLHLADSVCDTGSMEIEQVIDLLKRAVEFGLKPDDALELLKLKAGRRNVPFNISDSFTFTRNIKCGCGVSNPPLQSICGKCASRLYYNCPSCGKAQPVDCLSCACGYSIENLYNEFNEAVESGTDQLLVSLWEKNNGSSRPELAAFSAEYEKAKKRDEHRRRHEKEFSRKFDALMTGIRNNNHAEIRRAWDENMFKNHPDIIRYMPLIKQAHQPPDVCGLKAIYHGGYISLQWNNNPHISTYTVVWSVKQQGRTWSPKMSLSITSGDYEKNGCRIENPAKGEYSICLLASTNFCGEILLSPGTGPGCKTLINADRSIKISYEITLTGIIRKKSLKLTIYTEESISNLPAMVLMARTGNILPVDIQSAMLISPLPGGPLSAGEPRQHVFDISMITMPARFRLFLSNPADAGRFELIQKF